MLTSGESVVQMIKVTLKTRVIAQSLILCVGKYSSESSWRDFSSQWRQDTGFSSSSTESANVQTYQCMSCFQVEIV